MNLKPVILSFLCVTIVYGAHAADSEVDPNGVFGLFGFDIKKEANSTKCDVQSSIDQSKFVKSIPALQELKLINKDVTQTQINMKPKTLSMVFAIQMAPVVIPYAFSDPKTADTCYFTQSLISTDIYGNDLKFTIFKYKFTRALNTKVNWSKFEAGNLVKIAPNFEFSREFMLGVQSERD